MHHLTYLSTIKCMYFMFALVAACQVEVHRLVWFVGILAFTIAMILFVIGLARKMDPLNAFVNGFILVVVANVPEVRPLTCCGQRVTFWRQAVTLPC